MTPLREPASVLRALPLALGLALVPPCLLAKAHHWGAPWQSAYGVRVWLRDVFVSSHGDVAFAALFGLVCGGLLLAVRRRPRAARWLGAAALVAGALAAFYAVASVQIFAFLRSPLTYPLLYLAGDMHSMRSSIGSFVSPGLVLAMAAASLGYLGLARALHRRLAVLDVRRLALWAGAGLVVAACWAGLGRAWAAGRWSDRPDALIARSPHLELLRSLAFESHGLGGPTLTGEFPERYLDDFRPARHERPTARPAAAAEVERAARRVGARGPARVPAAQARPQNVLLVVLESTGARYLGLYGSPYATTPRLTAEAAHALVFERFYAHVGLTANSLAALTLSVHPYMTWREYTQEYPDFPGTALAQVLQRQGYRTAFLTSSFLEYVGQDRFLSGRGFDLLADWNVLGRGQSTNSWGGSDAVLVDRTLEWLDREPQRPFFGVVWTQQSHHPYDPVPGQPLVDFFAGRPLPPDDYDLGRYLNTLAEVDRQLGRLFDGLRARGHDRDTLVLVTGDHGEAFGDPHPTWGHGFRLYDEGLRVPLMVWSPALFPQGRRVSTVGGHVDVNPTVLDLLGLPAPDDWEGRSLFAPDHPQRAYFYAANDDYLLGVREGDLKYIYNASRGREELYDLVRDPDERRDLSGLQPATCARLRARLVAWKQHAAGRLDRARAQLASR